MQWFKEVRDDTYIFVNLLMNVLFLQLVLALRLLFIIILLVTLKRMCIAFFVSLPGSQQRCQFKRKAAETKS